MIDLSQELQAALRALHPELDALIRRAVREEVAQLHSHGSPDELLTAEQVAALVGMSPGALRRAAERGRFPVRPVRVGRRLRWRRGDLLGLLDGHQQASTKRQPEAPTLPRPTLAALAGCAALPLRRGNQGE